MSNQLIFQNTALTEIKHNNQTYISASDLSKALEYSDASAVNRIYTRHSDEFTSDMTCSVNLTDLKMPQYDQRIFSLRGAHLIAMFARTKVAKDFRKWVLDLLDKELAKKSTALRPLTITPEEQQQIQHAVQACHHRTGLSYAEIYRQLKVKFKVGKYDQLQSTQMREVLIFLTSLSSLPQATIPAEHVLIPINILEGLVKHSRLAKRHGEALKPAMRSMFELLGLDPYRENRFAAQAHDLAYEFTGFLRVAERILADNQQPQPQLGYQF